jgi:hypothetical protein
LRAQAHGGGVVGCAEGERQAHGNHVAFTWHSRGNQLANT